MPRVLDRFLLPACVVTALLVGCSNDKAPTRVQTGPPFVADSAVHLLRLLEWSFNSRAEDEFRTLFSDDFCFVFSAIDTNGNAYRAVPWTREDETISTRNLFLGGDPTQPAATSIALTFDRNFAVTADTRNDGITRNPLVNKQIKTTVILNIRTADGAAFDVTGHAVFFMSRGDSALVPEGLPSDSTRWYITRWEDETIQGGRLAPLPIARPEDTEPSRNYTWGSIKVLYR